MEPLLPDAMMRNKIPDALLDEALERVTQTRAGELSEADLLAWRRRSNAHEQAASAAERFLAVAPMADVNASRRGLRTNISARPALAMAAAFVLLPAALALVLWRPTDAPQTPSTATLANDTIVAPLVYRTGYRERREHILEDGSRIWLGWSSEVAVFPFADTRRVAFRGGRVAFKVTSDPARPFVVDAGPAAVRVTGTEFTVADSDKDDVRVAVLEGSVAVSAREDSVQLAPGDVVTTVSTGLTAVNRRPLRELGAWREGLLVFVSRPIADAIETLAPYTQLRLDARRLQTSPSTVTGTFFTDRGDDALRALMSLHGLETRPGPAGTTLLVQTPSRPGR